MYAVLEQEDFKLQEELVQSILNAKVTVAVEQIVWPDLLVPVAHKILIVFQILVDYQQDVAINDNRKKNYTQKLKNKNIFLLQILIFIIFDNREKMSSFVLDNSFFYLLESSPLG